MKRIAAIVLSMVMLVTLCACAPGAAADNSEMKKMLSGTTWLMYYYKVGDTELGVEELEEKGYTASMAFNEDNTCVLEMNTDRQLIQNGKYSGDDEDGVLTITLNGDKFYTTCLDGSMRVSVYENYAEIATIYFAPEGSDLLEPYEEKEPGEIYEGPIDGTIWVLSGLEAGGAEFGAAELYVNGYSGGITFEDGHYFMHLTGYEDTTGPYLETESYILLVEESVATQDLSTIVENLDKDEYNDSVWLFKRFKGILTSTNKEATSIFVYGGPTEE